MTVYKYDSKEELYFHWYVEELIQAELVNSYILQPDSFVLFNELKGNFIKRLKTKVKYQAKRFIGEHVYTPDGLIQWNKSAIEKGVCQILTDEYKLDKKIPFICNSDLKTYIEIKPIFDYHNMTRAFTINQKWVYDKHGIYVQLVKPDTIFKSTFTPKRFLLTDVSKNRRKINWDVITIETFLNINK